jgi:predicted TIM-barrel fold metal-dependent hydrolase
MDFGKKNFVDSPEFKELNIHYNNVAIKPIAEQVIDLFNGIKKYKKKIEERGQEPLFLIFPFLGLNTVNYDLGNENHLGSDNSLMKLLDKYFDNYDAILPQRKLDNLRNKFGKFDGDIDAKEFGSYFFSGIKVYPPLGFNPWPAEKEYELVKVKYLYEYCQKKRIPITAHCSMGGYQVVSEKEMKHNCSPDTWENVLEKYPGLVLNFAHFGGDQTNNHLNEWREKITELMFRYPNVYADISCLCFEKNSYSILKKDIQYYTDRHKQLNKTLMQNNSYIPREIMDRILFGSDFMINLIWADSYLDYIQLFSQDQHFTADEKDKLCSQNPENFIFG